MLQFPFDPAQILRKKRSIRRQLAEQTHAIPKRIAILGGSTTSEFRDCLELFLLSEGIRPELYESDYDKFYEDGTFSNQKLDAFKPELVFVFTSTANVRQWPELSHRPEDVSALAQEEMGRWRSCWEGIAKRFGCTIIQNNFESPFFRTLGNADFSDFRGRVSYVNRLNSLLVHEIESRTYLHVHDLNYLAASYGLDRWFDRTAWLRYKFAFALEAMPLAAHSASALLKAIWGKTKKCLVLDLDNTLWGGVVGEEGQSGIRIGKENAEAEAFSEFQSYAKQLHARGVLLAVCSKNDHASALSGLQHPDSVLRPEHFAAMRANWEPKSRNIAELAAELNIGLDALVFVDDNPVERHLVGSELPQVSVPDVGEHVETFVRTLENSHYFEVVGVSREDLSRSQQYKENSQRRALETNFQTYDDFLRTLDMRAEIAPFSQTYLDRIMQLANKTNQFNLTTRRFTHEEVNALAVSSDHIAIYGRLVDRFGDNGLIALSVAKVEGTEAAIELWLMSCRVLKRGMEWAMMDALVLAARARGVKTLRGYYLKTPKNQMVETLLGELGFTLREEKSNRDSEWTYEIPDHYEHKNRIIRVSNGYEHNESGTDNLP